MKTVSDYLQLLESEGSVNTATSGAIASKDVPLGAVKKRKVEEDTQLDEKKEVAHYGNKIGTLAKIYHNPKSGKYLAKHFLNGSHHHGHDTVHDSEEEARQSVQNKIPKGQWLKESGAYEGDNPLAANAGKIPFASGAGLEEPKEEDNTDNGHMFKMKQAAQQNYS